MKLQELRKAFDTTLPEDYLIIHLMAEESRVKPAIIETEPTPEYHEERLSHFKNVWEKAGGKNKAAFKKFMGAVAKAVEDRDPSEFYTMPGGYGDTDNCSQCATWMQKVLGGQIYGWEHGKNPEAEIGTITHWNDHDFLLVDDRWLVDFWIAWGFPTGKAGTGIYDLNDKADAAEVKRLYGPRDKWEKANPAALFDPWGDETIN